MRDLNAERKMQEKERHMARLAIARKRRDEAVDRDLPTRDFWQRRVEQIEGEKGWYR